MKIAVISDIHANLEALTKALDLIEELGIEEIICLGDIVGYGANPNECVEIIRNRCSTVLLGNHDLAAVNLATAESFTSNARAAASWTSEQLTPANKEYLRQLPYTKSDENILLVHSSPFEPEEWHYVISVLDAQRMFRFFTEEICFIGHSHVPGVFSESSVRKTVRRGERFLVNVGSIGQPRDGNPHLSFGVFDTSQWEYNNVRSEYDVEAASEKILHAGLPGALAERLLVGV